MSEIGTCGIRMELGSHWLVVEGTVGVEGLAGGLLEEDLVVAEEAVDVVALFERDEEDFAVARCPRP